MRVRSAALLVLMVCLLPIAAKADITGISPQSITAGGVENYVSISGTNLSGTESTFVVFDGLAGNFAGVPSNPIPDPDPDAIPQYPENLLIAYVPDEVAATPGTYQITVVYKDTGMDAVTLGPVTFTVEEETFDGPPLIFGEEIHVEEATSSRGAIVHFEVAAIDPDGTPLPVTCNPPSGSQFAMGGTLVSCSASNSFGTSTTSVYVLVVDFTGPVVTVPADIVSTNAVVTFEASAVDQIDGARPVTCSPASGSTFTAGVTQVTCSASDESGNIGYGFFTVTLPGGLPVITVPGDLTADSPDGESVVVPFTVTATNDAEIVCLYGPAPGVPFSGNRFDVGVTTLTCTATNLTGSDTDSFTVTVRDLSAPPPPELTVPDDITVEATSPAGAEVTFTATATNDGVVVCTPASGSTFALGETTVTCTATNDGGSDTDTFTVTVVDSTPPQILSVDANPAVLWPPNHQMVNVTVTVVAVDVADPTPVSRIISVTSNQPVNGTGDGDTAPDWQITGPLTVKLRSERSHGQDRTYTITVETVDASGNSTTATDTVVVTNSKRRAVH